MVSQVPVLSTSQDQTEQQTDTQNRYPEAYVEAIKAHNERRKILYLFRGSHYKFLARFLDSKSLAPPSRWFAVHRSASRLMILLP